MQPARLPLRVIRGVTLNETLRLMQPSRVYKPIESIEPSAPVRIKVPGHGLVGTWPVWFSGVDGLPDLNREVRSGRPHSARVVDVDTLEINAIDATGMRPRGGRLVYLPPVDLAGVTGVLRVFDARTGKTLLQLDADNQGLQVLGPGTLRRRIEASADLPWSTAPYRIDLTFPDGTVVRWFEGDAEVVP